jgi:hypothetical protein
MMIYNGWSISAIIKGERKERLSDKLEEIEREANG